MSTKHHHTTVTNQPIPPEFLEDWELLEWALYKSGPIIPLKRSIGSMNRQRLIDLMKTQQQGLP